MNDFEQLNSLGSQYSTIVEQIEALKLNLGTRIDEKLRIAGLASDLIAQLKAQGMELSEISAKSSLSESLLVTMLEEAKRRDLVEVPLIPRQEWYSKIARALRTTFSKESTQKENSRAF